MHKTLSVQRAACHSVAVPDHHRSESDEKSRAQEWQGVLSKSLHHSLLLWILDLRWFGFYIDSSVDFTVAHEIFSFSKYIEGTGIKELILFSVLKSVRGPRCSEPQP